MVNVTVSAIATDADGIALATTPVESSVTVVKVDPDDNGGPIDPLHHVYLPQVNR